jgi:imidazolonepropionase-like amidohydrolase
MFLRCALALLAAASMHAQTFAITGARVFDGTGKPPYEATVIIRGNRIEAAGPAVHPPAGARVVDARGLTLIPGLFDLHTHLPYSAVSGVYGDWPKILKAYLYCGVTTVVDFGIYPEMFAPMRRLLADGTVPGPRVHMAARMSTPLGHGLEGGRGDLHTLEVTTPREAKTAVERWLSYNPDAIKVFTDGWRYGAAPDMTSMEEDTLKVIVDAAHKRNVEVLTHTVTLARAKIAARAGVDVIAHGIGDSIADAELIRLMRERETTYAPTHAVYEPRAFTAIPTLLAALLEPAARESLSTRLRARTAPPSETNLDNPRLARWQRLMQNSATLRAGGVRFGTGTDAGVGGTWHGWATLRELQLLVAGGHTPLEALAAATGNSARALHAEGDRGFIAEGKLADLVLIDGRPDENIGDIERISRVFLNGVEVDRPAMIRAYERDDATPLSARPAPALVDDMELPGRSRLDTLRVNQTDGGHDHSRMSFGVILREPANHALAVQARMADKARPFAAVVIPLTMGGVEPADASAFTGVEFEVRGDGRYELEIPTLGVRDGEFFRGGFSATGSWTRARVPFASLSREKPRLPARWTGRDLQALVFRIAREPGDFTWLEIDNVRFY